MGLCVISPPDYGQAQSSAVAQASPARAPAEDPSIRPFKVQVPQAALDDLRRRIAATRWPDKETVADRSQGTQLAKLQELVRYWGSDYDWRKAEAKLNALPQFVVTIDGLDIHFIHVRARHANALPIIITHGWPGSVTEQLKLVGPLPDPTAHGGGVQDAKSRSGRISALRPTLASTAAGPGRAGPMKCRERRSAGRTSTSISTPAARSHRRTSACTEAAIEAPSSNKPSAVRLVSSPPRMA